MDQLAQPTRISQAGALQQQCSNVSFSPACMQLCCQAALPHLHILCTGEGWRKAATHVSFGSRGTKLVATYHADQVPV